MLAETRWSPANVCPGSRALEETGLQPDDLLARSRREFSIRSRNGSAPSSPRHRTVPLSPEAAEAVNLVVIVYQRSM
jgi:hypothetical protein